MVKLGGNEKHIKYVKKTRKFYEIRGKFEKAEGNNNSREIGGNALKQQNRGKFKIWSQRLKEGHQKFWRMKIEIFGVEKVKLGKFSTESENFSEIGGNLKRGEIHHYLRGDRLYPEEVLSTEFRVSSPEIFILYAQICLFLQSHHFGKCSHLISLYIIRYNNISRRPHTAHSPLTTPTTKSIWGSRPLSLQINAYDGRWLMRRNSFSSPTKHPPFKRWRILLLLISVHSLISPTVSVR